jgi:hypothetical protein
MKSSKSNIERNRINWAEKGDESEWIIVDDYSRRNKSELNLNW